MVGMGSPLRASSARLPETSDQTLRLLLLFTPLPESEAQNTFCPASLSPASNIPLITTPAGRPGNELPRRATSSRPLARSLQRPWLFAVVTPGPERYERNV